MTNASKQSHSLKEQHGRGVSFLNELVWIGGMIELII